MRHTPGGHCGPVAGLKRFLFNFVALLSLVVCAVLLMAWAQSPWGFSNPAPRRLIVGGDAWFLTSRAGALRVVRQYVEGTPGPNHVADPGGLGVWRVRDRDGNTSFAWRFGPEDTRHGALGFAWDHRQYTHGGLTTHYHEWGVPYWFLLLVVAVAPALWVRAWARVRRREVTGLCPKCGYDLRTEENAEGVLVSRCPECGAEEGAVPE